MTGVRIGELGFEGRCDGCHEWFPIALEFWPVHRSFRICRACHLQKRRIEELTRSPRRVAYNRVWRVENPEKVAMHAAQYREAKNARARARHLERMLTDPAYVLKKRSESRESMRRMNTDAKRESDRIRQARRRAAARMGRQVPA